MATHITCDRCKAEVRVPTKVDIQQLGMYDLCRECVDLLKLWIRTGPDD